MKQNVFLSIAALALTVLAGCGGGGKSGSTEVSRDLLAGPTEKTWKLVAIRGNSTYTGGGVDVPCAASLKKAANARISFNCGAAETIVLRQSGTVTYRGFVGFSWKLSGSTVTFDDGLLDVREGAITVEPTAAGAPRRLRVRQTLQVVVGVRETDDDGCELIIEEVL